MSKTVTDIKNEQEKFKIETGMNVNEGQDMKTDSLEELEQDYGTLKIRGEIKGSNIINFRTNLTGQDMKICKSRYDREKQTKAKTIAEVDDDYFLMMAERMTGIPYKEFYDLHIVDTNKVVRHVRDFLGE